MAPTSIVSFSDPRWKRWIEVSLYYIYFTLMRARTYFPHSVNSVYCLAQPLYYRVHTAYRHHVFKLILCYSYLNTVLHNTSAVKYMILIGHVLSNFIKQSLPCEPYSTAIGSFLLSSQSHLGYPFFLTFTSSSPSPLSLLTSLSHVTYLPI
jgi:hypothetical protein